MASGSSGASTGTTTMTGDGTRRREDIFVSSTSNDLAQEYRPAVRRAIEALSQYPIMMEDFGARDGDGSGVSTAEVAAADLVLVVVAWRYGYVPEGETRSITHLEYLEARRLGKPVLVFLAAPETEARDDLFPHEQRDTEQHAKQLKAFRAELERARAVAYFSTPADLYEAVIHAVHTWLRSRPVGHNSVGREETEAPRPPANLRPFLDPRDPRAKRYPRPVGIQALRGSLVICWLVVVGYLGTVAWNIYGLIHAGFAEVTPDNLRAALELPGPLASADAPLWMEGLFAAGMAALAGACFWATRDRAIEHDVVEWRHKREIYERLPPKGATSPTVEVPGAIYFGLDAPDDQHFVGREHDLAEVLNRLRTLGLAAISGLGGVGKTALAGVALRYLRETGEYPGGIVAVRCEGLTDPVTVLRLVLERFGQADGEMEGETLDQLGARARRVFAGKRALVALDNVEPEWPVGEVISRLREAGVALLLTSRQIPPRAVVPVEASYMLEVLAPEEALRLFAQSYGRPDTLDLTREERGAAERITRALGYHTLAIKLEGANAADLALDLGEMARDLEAHPEHGLDLAEDEVPAAVQRAFARSIEKLPDEARRLFAALAAVPTGEFGRGAALALAGGIEPRASEADLDLLVRRALAEASLDTTMPKGSDRQRLRLHPLMRAYATREFALWTEKERRAASFALAGYYAEYANETADRALGPDEDNITGMLEWAHAQGEDDLVMRLCSDMQIYWRDRSRVQASLTYLPWGIAAARTLRQDTLLGYLLRAYGDAIQIRGDIQGAEAAYTEALAVLREADDELGTARLLEMLGRLEVLRGHLDQAETYYQQAKDILEARGADADLAILLSSMGDLLARRGDLAGAQQHYERYLAIMQEIGETRGEGVALSKLGDLLAQRGDLAGAQANYERVLAIMREVGDTREEGIALSRLGDLLRRRGDLAGAQQHYERYLVIMQEIGAPRSVGIALSRLGDLLMQRGDLAGAQANYERVLAIMREMGDRQNEGGALSKLGQIAQGQGRLDEAEDYFQQSLVIDREVQDRQGEGVDLAQLGDIAASRGRDDAAEAYYRQALAVLEETQDVSNVAAVAVTFGEFLITRQDRREEGCAMLGEAARLYDVMGVPGAEAARATARRLGCGDAGA